MKKNSNPMELSYYRLSLLSYLKESHPDKASDTDFIKNRADEAAEAYSQAIKDGLSHAEAEELANLTLFKDLLFSKQDMLINILWNEFSDIIPQSEAKEYARKILSQCEMIFLQYMLSDEFIYSADHDKLYTELVGFVDLWLHDNEL